jgi:hypothetical protein
MITRAAVLAACLAGAAGGLLATPAIAGATVTNTTPQYEQPSGIVYSFQNLDSGSAGTLMEDNGNNMNDGGTVDTWTPYIGDQAGGTAGSGPILQQNEQWEFIPAASNTGGTLATGYGELVNHQSGLCLDVNNNNTADMAIVDQWQCFPGAENEQWTAVQNPYGSGWEVQAQFDQAYLGTNNEYCQPLEQPDGDPIMTRTDPSNCTNWQIQRISYEFASNQVTVPEGVPISWDSTIYNCISGYTMRLNPEFSSNPGISNPAAYTNLSSGGVSVVQDGSFPSTENLTLSGEPAYNHYNTPYNLTGQIMYYCDPNTTSP